MKTEVKLNPDYLKRMAAIANDPAFRRRLETRMQLGMKIARSLIVRTTSAALDKADATRDESA